MNIWLSFYLLSLCGKCWWGWELGGGVGGGFRERKTEWVMVKVSDRKSTALQPLLPKPRESAAKQCASLWNPWLKLLDHLASTKYFLSDFMYPDNHNQLPEGPASFGRPGRRVNTTKSTQSLNQRCHYRSTRVIWSPCDLGWKGFDRSGIRCRAQKNSLLI